MRPSFRFNPRRWLDNWPFKLAALLLAVTFWFFVRTDDSVTGQRTLNVPLTVLGLDGDELASGVPERVEVTIYGPSTRVDALRAESVDAFLDLQDVTGDFDAPVNVFPPQGLTPVRVAPNEVIGTVQAKITKRVPVRAALYGPRPDDSVLRSSVTPGEVSVTGLRGQVERVQVALAPVPSQEDEPVRLYAADNTGLPVPEVRLEPNQAQVAVRREDVLHTRRLPLRVTLPDMSPLEVSAQTLSQQEILLAGPRAALSSLQAVSASVSEDALRGSLPAGTGSGAFTGTYTYDLALQLPEGVRALEMPRLEVQLGRPAENPEESPSTGGAESGPPGQTP